MRRKTGREVTIMKASAFSYARATSVADALALLASHGDRAKVLSGGQSLMPAMNLRLISPELIVDIGDLAELRGIAVNGDTLRIGALTRHVDLQRSPDIAAHAPLLAEAIAHVAHPAIRNRGTIGGSLAHADPASELPACMVAPVEPTNSAHFFHEFARRHGDYAIAGLAAQAVMSGNVFTDLRLAFFAVGDRPVLALAANRLVNVSITPAVLSEASAALAEELDPQEDQEASASMRRHLAKVLMRRCVAKLFGRTDLDAGGSA
jgi:carbon-monoxide dehydrogenase medium subunit